MALDDAIARWCPTLDPAYGSFTLTDLIGGVGNFTLPSNAHWRTESDLKFLTWETNWVTHRTPGPIQTSAQDFSLSLWMDFTSGVAWSALRLDTPQWTGWYGAGGSSFQNPENNNFSISISLPSVSGWRHVVYRQSGSNSIFISVNGVHSAAKTPIRNLSLTTARLALGASMRNITDNYFRGKLDDILLYDRVIEDNEIETLYSRGRGAELSSFTSSRRRRTQRGGYGL